MSSAIAEPTPPAALVLVQTFLLRSFQRYEAVADDPALAEEARVHVTGNDRLTPAEQVDIYRRQFWLRHDDVLREDFPCLLRVLGEDGWDRFVRDYLAAHPPHHKNLRYLAADASRFAASWLGFPERLAPLCREIITYELAFLDVFDGADPRPLDAAVLAGLSEDAWARATFELNPVVKRLAFAHPVHRFRLEVRNAEGDAPVALPAPAPTKIALFRKDLVVHFEELGDDAFALLEGLARGQTLIEACAALAAGKSEAETQALVPEIGAWFRRWSEWGFIADVRLDPGCDPKGAGIAKTTAP